MQDPNTIDQPCEKEELGKNVLETCPLSYYSSDKINNKLIILDKYVL